MVLTQFHYRFLKNQLSECVCLSIRFTIGTNIIQSFKLDVVKLLSTLYGHKGFSKPTSGLVFPLKIEELSHSPLLSASLKASHTFW